MFYSFFFFQAEDGIRDVAVTGVQTCALPIYNFSNGDTLLVRYSAGGENGFSPSSGMTSTTENLPGFGVNFNNLCQQAVGSWNHIFASNRVNTVSLALSRLSMDRTSQNDGTNDIVSALGIQGIGFGGKNAWGAPWFAVQGYT